MVVMVAGLPVMIVYGFQSFLASILTIVILSIIILPF
jgi:hypothetical protein